MRNDIAGCAAAQEAMRAAFPNTIAQTLRSMTYFITALTNDRAKLIKSETRTTDAEIAAMVAAEYERRGYAVVQRQEG